MDFEVVDKKDIREKFSYRTTVYNTKIEFSNSKDDLKNFREEVEDLLKKYAYASQRGSLYSEGFINFDSKENILKTIYVKQTSFLHRKVEGSELKESHPLNIFSTNMVKVKVTFEENNVEATFYGGNPAILNKVMDKVGVASKTKIKGNFKQLESMFSKEDMRKILDSFSEEISEIRIDPGDSDKLKKIVEIKKGEGVAFDLLYEAHITVAGIKVKDAPYVKGLIDDAGVFIRQIRGRVLFNGEKISCEVNSSGRVNIILPIKMRTDEELNNIGEQIYNELVENKIKKIKTISLDSYGKKGGQKTNETV